MKTPKHVFREYDIRGNSEAELSGQLVEALGRAVATYLHRHLEEREAPPRVAVARDCRLSGERILHALSRGLRAAGAEVIDIGVGPTPLLYFAAHHLGTDGGVMITASHNPPQDNGFKVMHRQATLFGPQILALREIIEGEDFWSGAPGPTSSHDLSEPYIRAVRDGVRINPNASPLRVVVDGGNGAAGPLGIRTLRALGLDPEPLFCDMDGNFPNHHPDPTVEENLVALVERVRQRRATLGIAWDGDGDRMGVVDADGNVVWGDKLMVMFSRDVLRDHPGATILGEVKCSQTLFDDIRRHGGEAVVCRTGHSLIKKRMRESGALLAGEMSGHLFFADRYFGFDDAIYAAARLLEIVIDSGQGPRELLADLPPTHATPEIRLPCDDALKFRVVDAVREHFRGRYPVLEVDGARIDFGRGAWGLCRASNTGPVLVLRFEALDAARCGQVRHQVESVVKHIQADLGMG